MTMIEGIKKIWAFVWASKYKYAIIAAFFAVLFFMMWAGIDAPVDHGND